MVGGFNTDVRHRGRVLHVQTEVTSRPRRQITTLLFEGGTILHTHTGALQPSEQGEALRERMEAQHVDFIESLQAGSLDRQLGLESEEPTPGREERPIGQFGEGVIGSSRLDEIVLAHLSSA